MATVAQHSCDAHNGKLAVHGKQVNFKANGDTTKLEHYKNGVLDGVKKQYYKGSKVFKEVNYVAGLMDGTFKMYNAQGVVIEEANYKGQKDEE